MGITYNAGTNTITVIGYTESTPCTFLDIYNADIAGSWGIVTKQCTSQFCINANLIIGNGSITWFIDLEKQIKVKTIFIETNGNFRLGELITNNRTKKGCFLNLYSYTSMLGNITSFGSQGILKIYDCKIETVNAIRIFNGSAQFIECLIYAPISGSLVLYNNTVIKRVGFYGAAAYGFYPLTSSLLIEDVFIHDNFRGISPYAAYNSTLKNTILIGNTWDISPRGNFSGILNLINTTFNTLKTDDGWTTGIIYKKYEFDLKVIDKDNNPIGGSSVKIWDKDNNLVVNTTTNTNGIISTQTITRGYYNQTNGNTLQESSPHLIKIEKTGYISYETNFTLEKVTWNIKLKKQKQLQIDTNGNCYNILQPTKGIDSIILGK